MNLEDILNAVNNGGHKWNCFRRSKTSKKKIIAALIAWSQNLSKQLTEYNERERELQHENGDLRCLQAQTAERLEAASGEINQYQEKETDRDQMLARFEKKARDLEEIVVSVKSQKFELELSKQQLENDMMKLEDEIKRKVEDIDHIKDALEKCTHDCQRKERQYLTLIDEKCQLGEKLRAADDNRRKSEMECNKLRDRLLTEERKQEKLQKDLSTTRQLLNESYRDKQETEKQCDAALESSKFQIFTLGKSLHQKRILVERMRREKEILMAYYQSKIYNIIQNKRSADGETTPPCIVFTTLDKCVQTTLLASETNTLKNKILDLEFRLYRHEKLVEALCDIIQSHDPSFILEEDEVLKSFMDPLKVCSCDNTPSDHMTDICLCTVRADYAESEALSSDSIDTCGMADSPITECNSPESESHPADESNPTDADKSISFESSKSLSMASSLGSNVTKDMSISSISADHSSPDFEVTQ